MIKIDEKLLNLEEQITLGVLTAKVHVESSCDEIIKILKDEETRVSTFTLDNYRNDALNASRAVYKKLGKDPSRYRVSSDSLFRRLIKNKGLYYVNNVVDINNIISLRTLWSVGAYDLSKVVGPVKYQEGGDEAYEGIGRGKLNINHLPVLSDDCGPFGSATSDSIRTMVTGDTEAVMMVIHGFGDAGQMESMLDDMKTYLMDYAQASDVNISLIKNY